MLRNVVGMIGLVVEPEMCIVTEFVAHGDLSKYLKSDTIISAQQRLRFMMDISCGMKALSSEGIVHRDLCKFTIV